MKKLVLLTLGFQLFACNNNSNSIHQQNGNVKSNIAANDETEAQLKAELAEVEKEEAQRLAKEAATRASFTVDKMIYDFGKVKAETDNHAVFKVTNTSQNPLIIEDVSASCGCTTAEKPEKPIPAGKTGDIKVVFHPNSGQLDKQEKSVTITANTEPKLTVLKIKAFVEK